MNKLEKILEERKVEVAEDIETFEYMLSHYQMNPTERHKLSMNSFKDRIKIKYDLDIEDPENRELEFKSLRFMYWGQKLRGRK